MSRTGRPSPQKPVHTAYEEELQPRFEWEDNASSHVLNVDLPGFVKEQLKLNYDEPTRSLNVRGERATGNGRFVRFNKDFRIPDNARLNEMRARFQSETLTVTVPKQTLILPPPPLPPLLEKDGPGKLPPTGEKVNHRTKEESSPSRPSRTSTLIPSAPLAPFPAPKPNNEERRDDSVKLPPLKGMKMGLKEERKLMVNVLMASLVLVALGASISHYNFSMGGRRN